MVNYIWENIFKRAKEDQNIGGLLKKNMLFHTLSNSEIRFVEKIVHIRDYKTNEPVFHQGEIGVGMYIIAKGSVDIKVHDLNSPNNSEILVTRLTEGDFFGELALVEENGKRSAGAVAATDSVLIGFFKPDLMEIIERSPSIGTKVVLRLSEVLGRRLRETTDKITQIKRELKTIQQETSQKQASAHGSSKTHTT